MNLEEKQAQHISNLLERRAAATPPAWMTYSTRAGTVAVIGDAVGFTIHAIASRSAASMGVLLGVHATVFGVLCIGVVALAVGLARTRRDIARATEQDQIDAHRHEQTLGAIRDGMAEISENLRQAKVSRLIEDLQHDVDGVIPIGRGVRRSN